MPRARGIVLEVGIGSGLNLPYYQSGRVEKVIGVDPDPAMLRLGERRRADCTVPLELLVESAEAMSLPDNSVDTVLLTYSLCSIPDPTAALAECRRVLKPDGSVLMCEHGLAAGQGTVRWQNRLDRVWSKVALGCHLNRNPRELLQRSGFAFDHCERFVLEPFPALMGTHYTGTARLA